MQSRLATTSTRSYWLFSAANNLALPRGTASGATRRTADPAAYSYERKVDHDLDGTKKVAETKLPLVPPKPPHASSPRLESIGVNHPLGPMMQQKRNNSVTAFEDVSCAGLDGSPWPREKKKEQREHIVDDKEYYKHHKPSPLSEIEVVDTRRPIRRATDGTAYDDVSIDVIGWRPEQLDTAEEALRRATEIWKQNAMRGDPSLPHSRVLRELRGEWF